MPIAVSVLKSSEVDKCILSWSLPYLSCRSEMIRQEQGCLDVETALERLNEKGV